MIMTIDHPKLRFEGVNMDNNPNSEKNLNRLEELKILYTKHFNEENEILFQKQVNHLRQNYPDHQSYLLYHLIAGSTPDPDKKPSKFDFPEGEVEAFLEGIDKMSKIKYQAA